MCTDEVLLIVDYDAGFFNTLEKKVFLMMMMEYICYAHLFSTTQHHHLSCEQHNYSTFCDIENSVTTMCARKQNLCVANNNKKPRVLLLCARKTIVHRILKNITAVSCRWAEQFSDILLCVKFILLSHFLEKRFVLQLEQQYNLLPFFSPAVK